MVLLKPIRSLELTSIRALPRFSISKGSLAHRSMGLCQDVAFLLIACGLTIPNSAATCVSRTPEDTVVCRTPVRFFLRGIEKPSGLYILRNSGNQSEISHHYRKAPESTDSVMIMAVSLAGCCMPLCTPLPLLILVLHAGEADFGINGIFWIGCWNYAIYITPRVSLCPLKKTGQVFCKQL